MRGLRFTGLVVLFFVIRLLVYFYELKNKAHIPMGHFLFFIGPVVVSYWVIFKGGPRTVERGTDEPKDRPSTDSTNPETIPVDELDVSDDIDAEWVELKDWPKQTDDDGTKQQD